MPRVRELGYSGCFEGSSTCMLNFYVALFPYRNAETWIGELSSAFADRAGHTQILERHHEELYVRGCPGW